MRSALLGLLLTVAFGVYAQEQPGTAMLSLVQPDCPAMLIRMHHTSKDFLQSAVLKNVGKQPVVAYRIGWVVVFPSGKNKLQLGLPVSIPGGAKPGETTEVPAQQVNPEFAKEGASAVVFFVTDVRFGEGQVWKADLESTEQEARKFERKVRTPL